MAIPPGWSERGKVPIIAFGKPSRLDAPETATRHRNLAQDPGPMQAVFHSNVGGV